MAEARMGDFEELVMLAVVGLGDNAYSVTIQEKLEREAGRWYPLGAIYTALMRLREKGLATSRTGEATNRRGGKRKRIYQITDQGMAALQESYEVRRRLWQSAAEVNPSLGSALAQS